MVEMRPNFHSFGQLKKKSILVLKLILFAEHGKGHKLRPRLRFKKKKMEI